VKDANGKWVHINEQGKLVGQMWRNVKYFQDGLAPVETQDEKWGFVDKTGKVVIPCQYYSVDWFAEGLAAVSKSVDNWLKYGFIDKTGKEVIPFKYRTAYSFSEGLAPVSEDDKTFGYIDKSEKVVIPFKFKKAYPFEHGKARVQDENGNWRKIDKTGKFIE
jgi:hypothetical protein